MFLRQYLGACAKLCPPCFRPGQRGFGALGDSPGFVLRHRCKDLNREAMAVGLSTATKSTLLS